MIGLGFDSEFDLTHQVHQITTAFAQDSIAVDGANLNRAEVMYMTQL